MGVNLFLSSYFENPFIDYFGEELNACLSLDKKFIILSEIDQKINNYNNFKSIAFGSFMFCLFMFFDPI